jgi:hypothetical protein
MDDLVKTMPWLESQEEKVCTPNEKQCIYVVGFFV